MYRFYVSKEQIADDKVYIEGTDVNHIKNVLRLEQGDWIIACDKEGTDYVSRISDISSEQVILEVEKVQDSDKMEFIIQKAVELGVSEIVPVAMKRCVVKLDDKKADKKAKRWQTIAEAAAKQSGRGIIPKVANPVNIKEAFDIAGSLEYNMIPYELQDGIQESRKIVKESCTKSSVGIFIGPEGGFEKEEVEEAISKGIKPISLGKRILRTETAGMAIVSIMMFEMQD